MKSMLTGMAVMLVAILSQAQEMRVTVAVSDTTSNQIAELSSNGIPLDYVIDAGYAQAVNRIKMEINKQIDGMNLEQLLGAYPKYAPLVDTNDRPEVAEGTLRNYAKSEVRRLKTVNAAAAAYAAQHAVVQAHPSPVADVPDRFKLKVDANGVATVGNTVVSTNAGAGK